MRDYEAVLPVCNPDRRLYQVISRLLRQDRAPSKINIYLTVTDTYGEPELLKALKEEGLADKGLFVTAVSREDFNHGGTRQIAAEACKAGYCLFMTQDAMPVDIHLASSMLNAFDKEGVAVCYARQLPYKNASIKERYARNFNYPDKSQVKDRKMLEQGKIKAIFCSDVCAMYDMKVFQELGGFERHVNFNEDMMFAHKALRNDYKISYVADARVFHSHNLSLKEQFRRNREIARSQKEHPEVFADLSSEDEGMNFVKNGVSYCLKQGSIFGAVSFIADCGFRFLGFQAGKRFK